MSHYQIRNSSSEVLMLLGHIAAVAESHYAGQKVDLIIKNETHGDDTMSLEADGHWIADATRTESKGLKWTVNVIDELIELI